MLCQKDLGLYHLSTQAICDMDLECLRSPQRKKRLIPCSLQLTKEDYDWPEFAEKVIEAAKDINGRGFHIIRSVQIFLVPAHAAHILAYSAYVSSKLCLPVNWHPEWNILTFFMNRKATYALLSKDRLEAKHVQQPANGCKERQSWATGESHILQMAMGRYCWSKSTRINVSLNDCSLLRYQVILQSLLLFFRGFPVEHFRGNRFGLVVAFWGLALTLGQPQVSQTDYDRDHKIFGRTIILTHKHKFSGAASCF